MRVLKKLFLVILLVFMVAISFSVDISAYGNDTGSIELIFNNEKASHISFSIYKIGDLKNGSTVQYVLSDLFRDLDVNLNEINTARDSEEIIAEGLALIEKKGILPEQTQYGNNQGNVVFNDLELGLYIIKQDNYPNGLKAESLLLSVPLNTDSGLIYNVKASPKYTYQPEVPKIEIYKVDNNGKLLLGAKLQILDGNNVIEEWVSTQESHVIKAKLEIGKSYYLHEVSAPNGYKVANDIRFTVKDDEKPMSITMIDIKEDAPPSDTRVDLIIYKVDQNIDFLVGAEFTLVKVVDDNEVSIGKQSGGPRFVFDHLDDGVYRVYETMVPDGYKGLDSYFEIEIINGNIYYEGELDYSFTVVNTNDGSEPEVLGDEIDEEDYDEWVEEQEIDELGEDVKGNVKTSDDQNIYGYIGLSLISLSLMYLLKKKGYFNNNID